MKNNPFPSNLILKKPTYSSKSKIDPNKISGYELAWIMTCPLAIVVSFIYVPVCTLVGTKLLFTNIMVALMYIKLYYMYVNNFLNAWNSLKNGRKASIKHYLM